MKHLSRRDFVKGAALAAAAAIQNFALIGDSLPG
jgi:hypothetical protein